MNNTDWDTLFFCELCQEEYLLPEDCCECPICMAEDIRAVG